jgi:hypothetical protein
MKSCRTTMSVLAVALATLFLAPSFRNNDACSVTAVRSSHARESVPAAVADVDPVSDHRATCADLCTDAAVPGMLLPDVVLVGRLPADTGPASRPSVDVRPCAQRGPPLA